MPWLAPSPAAGAEPCGAGGGRGPLHAERLCRGEPRGSPLGWEIPGLAPHFQGSAASPGTGRPAAARSCHQLQPRRLSRSRHRAGMLSPGQRRPGSSHLLPELGHAAAARGRETPPRPLLGPTSNPSPSGPAAPKASGSREGKEPSRGPSAAPGRGRLGPRVGTEAARSAPLSGCQRQIHSPRFGSPRQSAPAGGREFPGPETAPWRLSPRWEAGDVPSQSPEHCRHSPSPTAAGSLLPSAGPMPGGLRGPGGSGREETDRPATRTGSPRPPCSGSSSFGSRVLETRIPANSTSTEEAKPLPGSQEPPPQRPSLGRRAGRGRSYPRSPPVPELEMPLEEPGTRSSRRGSGAGPGTMPWGR